MADERRKGPAAFGGNASPPPGRGCPPSPKYLAVSGANAPSPNSGVKTASTASISKGMDINGGGRSKSGGSSVLPPPNPGQLRLRNCQARFRETQRKGRPSAAT